MRTLIGLHAGVSPRQARILALATGRRHDVRRRPLLRLLRIGDTRSHPVHYSCTRVRCNVMQRKKDQSRPSE